MSWDEVISGWTETLDRIDGVIAAGDWASLEELSWPNQEPGLTDPTEMQRRRVTALSQRQLDTIDRIREMLEDAGRDLRAAEKLRGAVRAYGASERSATN